MKVTAALLAAGGSSRFGKPKQLLSYHGRPLMRGAAETACASSVDDVIVVIGPGAPRMRAELAGLRARPVENGRWREGLSTSIRLAVHSLAPTADALLLMACDQPAVTTAHIELLLRCARSTPAAAVTSGYGGTLGIPAVFPRALFPDLLRLSGDAGAKSLLRSYGTGVIIVPLPGGELDIDTPADATPSF